MARKAFSIHSDYYDELRNLDSEKRGDLLLALINWATDLESPNLEPESAILFRLMCAQIERVSVRNAENGKKGGAPTGNQNASATTQTSETSEQSQNKPPVSVTVSDTDTSIDCFSCAEPPPNGDAPPTTKRFKKPSVEDVTAYCRERGNTIDPQHFVDYYMANGWKTGRNPMKDWKAAVRTWEKNERGREARSSGTQYGADGTAHPDGGIWMNGKQVLGVTPK